MNMFHIHPGRIPSPVLRELRTWVETEARGRVQWIWHDYPKDDKRREQDVPGEWTFVFDDAQDLSWFLLQDWVNAKTEKFWYGEAIGNIQKK